MKKRYLLTIPVILTSLSINCTTVQAQAEFANTSTGFTTTSNVTAPAPEAAVLADLNSDGHLDAVIANGNFNSGFTAMLNDGSGNFSPPQQYTTGFESWDVCVADFTGDNIPDVVVSNRGSNYNGNTISLFPGNGNGTFGTKTNYTVGAGPVGITAADFNNDGYMDAAVANNGGFGSGTTVSVLFNNTTGGFNTAITYQGGPMPYKIASGLIDADSLPDIVVANEQEKITVMHNTGNGFANTTYIMQSQQFNNLYASIQLADIDNDTDLDIFYSSFGTQQIALRKNLGNGILDSAQLIVMDGWYGGASSFQITDLNNDNLKDILATASTGSAGDGYRYVLNQGNGTFGPELMGTGGQYTFVVLSGDVDQDSDNDILTIDNYSNELTVHKNNGSGQFSTPVLFSTGFPGVSTKLEAADIDNDGDLDIATSADSRTAINVSVAVSRNNGNGTFTNAIIYSGFTGGVGVKLRDINNDGFADLVYASGINSAPYDFYTAINNGNGTFGSPQQWSMNSCGWNDLEVADLDNDGDLDVIISEWLGCSSVPNSARRLFISYNQGNGTFSSPSIKLVNPFPGPLAVCDFNEDGFIDVATGNSTTVDICLNDGSGGLLAPVSFPMSQSPFDILAADLNNDSHIDIASCNYGSNPGDYNLTIRLGNGNGTFQNVQLLDAAYSPDIANVSGIAAGDVDNDGDLDLVVSQNASNDMTIYTNDGAGVFTIHHRLCAYYSFRSPWFDDFTGDGIADLAGLVSLHPSNLPSALTILPGISTGTLTGGAGLSGCNVTTTSISEINASEFDVQAMPNPFHDKTEIHFMSAEDDNITLQITDAIGKTILQSKNISLKKGWNSIAIALPYHAAGVYNATILSATSIKNLTIIKN